MIDITYSRPFESTYISLFSDQSFVRAYSSLRHIRRCFSDYFHKLYKNAYENNL